MKHPQSNENQSALAASLQGQQNAAAQQAAGNVVPQFVMPNHADEAPATRSFRVRPDGSILLIKPILELHGDVMWNRRDVRTLKRIWQPEEAVIAGGMLIIDEWKVFLPLSYLHVGRWDDAPKVDPKTS